MKEKEIIDKLDILTSEADMLTEVLHNALKHFERQEGITSICYLTEEIRKKFDEMRDLF